MDFFAVEILFPLDWKIAATVSSYPGEVCVSLGVGLRLCKSHG